MQSKQCNYRLNSGLNKFMKYCSLQVTANHFLCVLCRKKIFQTGLSSTHQNVHYAEFSLVIEANKYHFRTAKIYREKTSGNSSTEIPFVVTHNPGTHNIFNDTRYCLLVLHQSQTVKNIIKEKTVIYSRRQPPNQTIECVINLISHP